MGSELYEYVYKAVSGRNDLRLCRSGHIRPSLFDFLYGVKMRLDKFLSEAGAASRRSGAEAIRKGLVFVDGVCVKKPQAQIDRIIKESFSKHAKWFIKNMFI